MSFRTSFMAKDYYDSKQKTEKNTPDGMSDPNKFCPHRQDKQVQNILGLSLDSHYSAQPFFKPNPAFLFFQQQKQSANIHHPELEDHHRNWFNPFD